MRQVVYKPKGKYVWDLWMIKKGHVLHVFYLQSPSTVSPDERHNVSSIGHATTDANSGLTTWKESEPALTASRRGADDLCLWTGSVFKSANQYFMFYTGRSRTSSRVQRICLATSSDLFHWRKSSSNPILEADQRFYRMEDKMTSQGDILAWRDPYVFQDPQTKKTYMLISANTKAHSRYSGCIAVAQARSNGMTDWQVLPPLISPGIYTEMETPQLVFHKGLYYVFFSVWAGKILPVYAQKHNIKVGGIHAYVSDKLFGVYKPVNGSGVVTDTAKQPYGVYSARLIDHSGDTYRAIGWVNNDSKGRFSGGFSRPFFLKIQGDEVLFVTT